MLESDAQLSASVRSAVLADRHVLRSLQEAVRPLKHTTKRIQPRRSAAISIVATDGGHNGVEFDPFMVDVIRVVDSGDNQHCIEAVTPGMSVDNIDSRHFDASGAPVSALGRMMKALEVKSVGDLSTSIRKSPEERTGLWITIYRELTEWAVLLDLLRGDYRFVTDTVILFDGLLRTKKFSQGLFGKFQQLLSDAIHAQYETRKRRVYVVGIAKRNKFLQQYRLAMALTGVMRNTFPCYTPIPDDLQKTVYKWAEIVTGGGEGESFNAGQLFLVKFGSHILDPVWAVDVLKSQIHDAGLILGHLLFDAQEGFPVPYYPMSLQQAHEKAELAGLDFDILQDEVKLAIEECVGEGSRQLLDELALQPTEPEAARY